MNFDYSYRAFLITCLLVGNLVLLLLSVKLNKGATPIEVATPVEYSEDDWLEEDEQPVPMENVSIETNTAYNEAAKFISELEEGRQNTTPVEETTTGDDLPEDLSDNLALAEARSKLSEVKEKLANEKPKRSTNSRSTVNRKTTMSYYLEGRKELSLRNPVYTCESGGLVVISIEVNALGKVTKTRYNQAASTTGNRCLIDAALEYAHMARFTTAADKPTQSGSIRYLFPGQQ